MRSVSPRVIVGQMHATVVAREGTSRRIVHKNINKMVLRNNLTRMTSWFQHVFWLSPSHRQKQVSGQNSIARIDCHVLIDSGATHSFVAKRIVDRFNRHFDMHAKGFGTMLTATKVVISKKMIKACSLSIDCTELYVDLIKLSMSDFDVILKMDWLTKYSATIDCKKKMVVFKHDGRRLSHLWGQQ